MYSAGKKAQLGHRFGQQYRSEPQGSDQLSTSSTNSVSCAFLTVTHALTTLRPLAVTMPRFVSQSKAMQARLAAAALHRHLPPARHKALCAWGPTASTLRSARDQTMCLLAKIWRGPIAKASRPLLTISPTFPVLAATTSYVEGVNELLMG